MDVSAISLITSFMFNVTLFAAGVYCTIHLQSAIRQRKYSGFWPYIWRAWLISVFISPAFYFLALFVLKWQPRPLLWWYAMVKGSSLVTWWAIVVIFTAISIVSLIRGIFWLIRMRKFLRLLGLCLAIALPILLLKQRFFLILWWFAIVSSCLLGTYFIVYAVSGVIKARRGSRSAVAGNPRLDFTPTVSVIIPCHNEEKVIESTLRVLIYCNNYPQDSLEIIVVNDASTDGTLTACQPFVDQGLVKLIDRSDEAERGKAISVNRAIEVSKGEFICILDADHEVTPNFISQLLSHFKDPRVGLVQGAGKIKNASHNLLTRFTDLELGPFMNLHLFAKPLPFFMGSGGIFRRSVLDEVGEFNNELCTEDWDMGFRICEHGYTVIYDSSVWTWHQAVTSLRAYYHQRYRWMRGTIQAFMLHLPRFYTSGNVSLLQSVDFTEVLLLVIMVLSFNISTTTITVSFLLDWQLPVPYVPFLIYPIYLMIFLGVALELEGTGEKFFLFPGFMFYLMLYTMPNLSALVDELVLQKKSKGKKAERVDYRDGG